MTTATAPTPIAQSAGLTAPPAPSSSTPSLSELSPYTARPAGYLAALVYPEEAPEVASEEHEGIVAVVPGQVTPLGQQPLRHMEIRGSKVQRKGG